VIPHDISKRRCLSADREPITVVRGASLGNAVEGSRKFTRKGRPGKNQNTTLSHDKLFQTKPIISPGSSSGEGRAEGENCVEEEKVDDIVVRARREKPGGGGRGGTSLATAETVRDVGVGRLRDLITPARVKRVRGR